MCWGLQGPCAHSCRTGRAGTQNTDVYFSKPWGCLDGFQRARLSGGTCLVQSYPAQLSAFPWDPWGPQTLWETIPSCLISCWFLNGAGLDSLHSAWPTLHCGAGGHPSCPGNSTQGLSVELVCFVLSS